MEVIYPDKLTRNSEAIKSCFNIIGDVTIATRDIKIVFPTRYINRNLAVLGSTVKTLSVYAIIDEDDNYDISIAPIIEGLSPYSVHDAVLYESDYKILTFRKNDVVIANNNLVMSDGFLYEMFDEFFIKGNIPFFLDYDDVGNLFLETMKYANSRIGKNMLTFELLASIIARDPDDKRIFFRQTLKTVEDLKKKPAYVGINNVFYSLNTTAAKLIGGYFRQGIKTALVDNEVTTSKLSEILRK